MVLVAAATIVTLVLVNSSRPAGPGPDTMADGGITISTGLKAVEPGAASSGPSAGETASADPVRITLYVDYLCPICGAFESTNSEYIEGLVDSGAATIDIHPVAILSNRSQGTKYSLRAANAAVCVANSSPDQFFAVNQALYAEQPEENTKGLDDAQLRHLVAGVHGIRHLDAIERCIDTQRYAAWVDARTNDVLTHGVPGTGLRQLTGTPTIFVNGKRYDYSLPFTNAEFRTFVVTAAGSTYASGDETPAPTPTPTATSSAG